ncbi:membrane dipeptidase [Streptomyces parvulus]|uniref:membrane dipeptidase n=1 Tax=Streptomyces parvulus TaxID=146923 RepID=UPI0037F76B60
MTTIDACNPSKFDRELLLSCQKGGVSAVTVSLDMWGDSRKTLSEISGWYRMVRENADVATIIVDSSDFAAAEAAGKVGIVLGIQNTSPLDGDLGFVELFDKLGLKVMLLTYNNQNLVGSGCYESVDSGLSRFGRKVIAEMNRVGMIVDLAHCGKQTTLDAIEESSRPVAITHANPEWVYKSKRSKTREEFEALRQNGGVLGLTMFPTMMGGQQTTARDFVDMVARTVDVMGIDHVGFGSDLITNQDDNFLNHARMGTWTHEIDHGTGVAGGPVRPPWPSWFSRVEHFPNLAKALREGGFDDIEVEKVMGGNWRRFFEEGFARV